MQRDWRAGRAGELSAAITVVKVGMRQEQQFNLPSVSLNKVKDFAGRDAGVNDHAAALYGIVEDIHVVAQGADCEVRQLQHSLIIGGRSYNPGVERIDPLGRMGAARRVQSGRRGESAAKRSAGSHSPPADAAKLVEAIDSAGAELSRNPSGTVLERYRKAVREFLDLALAEGIQLSTESSFGLRSRVFSTITKVDGRLSELADAVLGRQQDVLRVREIVEQIKGLIVDLYR